MKYKDKVRIKKGFYEGQEGELKLKMYVTSLNSSSIYTIYGNHYNVDIGEEIIYNIHEDDLEIIN